MNIYMAIAGLALYGDLLKRVLGAGIAQVAVYGLFGLIIFVSWMRSNSFDPRFAPPRDNSFPTLCAVLLFVYLVQLITHFDAPLLEAVTACFYMALPLAYIIVIAGLPTFDVTKLAQTFLLLMPPILAVALVQYFIDATFLVDTSYSSSGGVVERNLLGNVETEFGVLKSFRRFPSLLASADRFSGVAVMQLFFTVLLASSTATIGFRRGLWLFFNVCCAVVALVIAGSRSRMLIVAIATGLACLTLLKSQGARRIGQRRSNVSIAVMTVAILMLALALVGSSGLSETLSSLPVFTMVQQTIENNDIANRIAQAIELNSPPVDVTVFGQGLGTAGVGGRPGEFAIRAMWEESGLFWTLLMLPAFGSMIAFLLKCTLIMHRNASPSGVFMSAVSFLSLALGVLTGLTATFELSFALTLFPWIAVATRGSRANRRAPVAAMRMPNYSRASHGAGR